MRIGGVFNKQNRFHLTEELLCRFNGHGNYGILSSKSDQTAVAMYLLDDCTKIYPVKFEHKCTVTVFEAGPDKSIVRLPGTSKKVSGQVKYFLTCPEKCIRYIGKPKEIQYFVAEVPHRTSRSNFDLSSPV